MKRINNNLVLTSISSFVFFLCLSKISLITLQSWFISVAAQAEVEVKVGVVINQESIEGKIGLSCIEMAISDFYDAHPEFKTRIIPVVKDSKSDPFIAAAAVYDLLKNVQVTAIIGPETSSEALFVVKLGEKAQVPIITYSATSPFYNSSENSYFIRATPDDSFQVKPLSALIKEFGWRNVVPIYVEDDFAGGIIPYLADELQKIGTHIPYRSVIPSSASDDQLIAELYKLKSMSTRVFIVHATTSMGSRLFLKAKELDMMSRDYVWIITSAMAKSLESVITVPGVIPSMQGVVGVKTYVPTTTALKNFTDKWGKKFQHILKAPMNVDGLRAYDAATALARAVEEVGVTNFTFRRASNLSADDGLSTLGVSRVGPQLVQAILSTKFKGLSGDFSLANGHLQVQSSTFRLINVNDHHIDDRIGYWTPSSGLVRKQNLVNITWPGKPTYVPKGWVISPNEKKLRIGVPVKSGFTEFVKITRDPVSNVTKVTGYCIDVFDAVMQKLPYTVAYEYIPFENASAVGQPAGDYNQLIEQVPLQKYDAVVGDVAILANRSEYVDFTQPFTEFGYAMIVRVKDYRNRAWLFIAPWTLDVWVTTFCFFIFIAFAIWVLEHRINEDFRGPPAHQVGTSLYYSFSTMVFSHSFSVFSNLTRFVLIIWLFVVLILIQSYTANLASLLTTQQLQSNITSIDELKKIREDIYVGYQDGSFIEKRLAELNFPNRVSYSSTEELHDLLSNGRIAAAFDEIPYVELFLSTYCCNYTKILPVNKSDGFGFAFPKGSPLVADVNHALLSLTELGEIRVFEDRWLRKQQNKCPDRCPVDSSALGLDSFWGLFTIVGVSAGFALSVSLTGFFWEHRHVWSDPSVSGRARIRTLLRLFDQRNLSSHTFWRSQPQSPMLVGTPASNTPPYPQSPSNYRHISERAFHEQQPIPSLDNSTPSSDNPEISLVDRRA